MRDISSDAYIFEAIISRQQGEKDPGHKWRRKKKEKREPRDIIVECKSNTAVGPNVPGPPRISYRASSVTLGFSLRSRERGWPIPPAAPRTVTLESYIKEMRPWLVQISSLVLNSEVLLNAN